MPYHVKDGLEQLSVELRRGGARGEGVLGGGVPPPLRALPRHRTIGGLGKGEAGFDSLNEMNDRYICSFRRYYCYKDICSINMGLPNVFQNL